MTVHFTFFKGIGINVLQISQDWHCILYVNFLQKHRTDDHADENPSPDEVLKCPMCEAVFYHLDAYEIHLTFHSSGDMYSDENPE